MIPEQITLTVARPHMQMVIEKYDKKGYILIHSDIVSDKKIILTFDRYSASDLVPPKKDLKAIRAIKLEYSNEKLDSIVDEVLKK